MAYQVLYLSIVPHPRFDAGQLVMTAGVDELVRQGRLNPSALLRRHLNGDWGDLCDEERRSNDAALKSGDRLHSSYRIAPDLTVWIVTEWNRSVTTLLLPDEN